MTNNTNVTTVGYNQIEDFSLDLSTRSRLFSCTASAVQAISAPVAIIGIMALNPAAVIGGLLGYSIGAAVRAYIKTPTINNLIFDVPETRDYPSDCQCEYKYTSFGNQFKRHLINPVFS